MNEIGERYEKLCKADAKFRVGWLIYLSYGAWEWHDTATPVPQPVLRIAAGAMIQERLADLLPDNHGIFRDGRLWRICEFSEHSLEDVASDSTRLLALLAFHEGQATQ